MKIAFSLLVSTLSVVMANSNILLQPPAVASPKAEIGVVWINGALCSTESYKKIAVAFQNEAAANGIKAWVDIPSFVFETPEPMEMTSAINTAKSAMTDAGFKGKFYVASHSLGTVQIQSFLEKNPDAFEASIMMGGGLTREKYVNDNSTGLTVINHTPSLSIFGSKDGLYRISRAAEAYYHQVENIDPKYKNKHGVVVIEGGSHGTFMDETMLSTFVYDNDLNPEIDQTTGHKTIATAMVTFLKSRLGEFENDAEGLEAHLNAAGDFLAPLIEGMKEEGSYFIKIPCYNISTINPDW